MRFFFDNCLPPPLAAAINVLDKDNEVVHLRDLFDQDAKDEQWISSLAAGGDWVIISGDVRITRRPKERQLWIASKLTAFFP